jgi:hypothetical protein
MNQLRGLLLERGITIAQSKGARQEREPLPDDLTEQAPDTTRQSGGQRA